MNALRTGMFYAICVSGGCSLAWFAIGTAIGLSVRSLRESLEMPLWFVIPLVWGLALTALLMLADGLLWAFDNWSGHQKDRQKNRHVHTWGKWYEREATVRYLGMGGHSVMVQCRDCETCGFMEYTR